MAGARVSMYSLFVSTLEVTLPVFIMVFLGLGLKRLGWIDPPFIATASSLVFNATLPTLIFLSIIRADLDTTLNPGLLLFFALATLVLFLLSWGWAILRVPHADRGVYVQGAFRGNCGIVGLALAAGMYGDFGLSAGGLLLGVVILTYNAFSVIALATYGITPITSRNEGRNTTTRQNRPFSQPGRPVSIAAPRKALKVNSGPGTAWVAP